MEKKKIAESIIIRVGGGIREIRRESIETADTVESTHRDSDLEQSEEMHPFQPDLGSTSANSKSKTVN